jgi:hypothetical protein
MSADNAHDLARAEFGDTDRLKSESRAVRAHARRQQSRASRFDVFRQDLSYSMRQLRRSPGFAMTAIATLMLGVGATVTIVSVVDAVVFEPLPFSEPGQVVFASMLTPEERMGLSAAGAALGLGVAWVLTRWIEISLYVITANDPLTWTAVLTVVGSASALAAYLPARKATQVDPRDVLTRD